MNPDETHTQKDTEDYKNLLLTRQESFGLGSILSSRINNDNEDCNFLEVKFFQMPLMKRQSSQYQEETPNNVDALQPDFIQRLFRQPSIAQNLGTHTILKPIKVYSSQIQQVTAPEPPCIMQQPTEQSPRPVKVIPVNQPPLLRSRSRLVNKQSLKLEETTPKVANSQVMQPCTCTKSHCLKMYCSCFHNGRRCSNECKCEDCRNLDEFKEDLNYAVEHVKQKAQRTHQPNEDALFNTEKVWGCNCKRTRCQKRYCECFIRKEKCTQRCNCEDCDNGRDEDLNYQNMSYSGGAKRKKRRKINSSRRKN